MVNIASAFMDDEREDIRRVIAEALGASLKDLADGVILSDTADQQSL